LNARGWGVQERYEDASGGLRTAPRETVERATEALAAGARATGTAPLIVGVRSGQRLDGVVEIQTEDGRLLACDGAVPDELAAGYHRALHADGASTLLIASPRRCVLPSRERAFGFAVQLYATRSARSWGIGDCADLGAVGAWSRSLGAAVLMLNPLHAPLCVTPQNPSPYSAGSRRYRNPLYIDIESVPGIERIGAELDTLRSAGRALLTRRRIDRDMVFGIKMRALERLWDLMRDVPELDLFIAADPGVLRYATFCALVERHGPVWREWPDDVRRPMGSGVERFRREQERRVRFHVWLQWLLDAQLARAAQQQGLMHDLAIGFDPSGADAWEWQDVIVDGFDVGAPADEFNTQGQNWGLAPFNPERLRAADYRPFIDTIQAAMRHSVGLRMDHVMGLFRLFWVPRGSPAEHGVYVRYPSADLLDILAVESERAGSYVVGEDLGTVEPGVREELAARDVLSYRVLWFDDRPESYPRMALAAVTTHDLPTVAGMWDGSDLRVQRELGLQPNEHASEEVLRRVQERAGLQRHAPVDHVVQSVYELLARAPCMLLAATLEDMCEVRERPNMPGTRTQWPNWSLALPVTLDGMMASPLPAHVSQALNRG